jgi:hypothetical protein
VKVCLENKRNVTFITYLIATVGTSMKKLATWLASRMAHPKMETIHYGKLLVAGG